MSLRLVTAATTPALSLAEAKAHLRVDSNAEDTLIESLVAAATDMAEQQTRRALMQQTWELTLDAFPTAFELTRVPVQSIASVKYTDISGVEQTLGPSAYTLDTSDGYGFAYVKQSYGTEWPSAREGVKVRYVAGYADAAAVPEPIVQWIKLMVSTMFDNRETEAYSSRAVSTTVRMQFVDRLLDRYCVGIV